METNNNLHQHVHAMRNQHNFFFIFKNYNSNNRHDIHTYIYEQYNSCFNFLPFYTHILYCFYYLPPEKKMKGEKSIYGERKK